MRKFLSGFVAVVGLLGCARWADAAVFTFSISQLENLSLMGYEGDFQLLSNYSVDSLHDETSHKHRFR